MFDKTWMRRSLAASACTAGALAGAWAETSPYYVGAGLTVTRDSNIDNTPVKESDTITSGLLLAGFDQPISRQRLVANATLRENRYSNNKDKNYSGYDLGARLDWETIERLSGTIHLRGSQGRFTPTLSDGTELILLRSTDAGLTARLGGVTAWTFEASLLHSEQNYVPKTSGAESIDDSDQRVDSGGLRVRYAGSPDLSIGAGVRAGKGRRTTTGVEFTHKDIDLLVDWRATGASTIGARASASRRDFDSPGTLDFSGATGLVNWQWTPTGKLKFNTRLARDTGQNARDAFVVVTDSGAFVGASADIDEVTTSLRIAADYAASGKVGVVASLEGARRSLSTAAGSETRRGADRLAAASLGVRWSPLRVATLSCDLGWRERRVTDDGTTDTITSPLTRPYKGTSVSCGAQIVLQP